VSTLDVSVVCSTYSRASRLESLLRALEGQTLPFDRFEVVIVNNGSTDETPEVLDKFVADSGLQLRPVTLTPNRGAAGGRNAGWRAARAPIVAFTDDDCVPAPDWLENGLAAVKASPPGIVVGRTQPNPAQRANHGAWSRTQIVDETNGTKYFNTCNIFYRHDDLAAAEGFDEEFRTKGGEDTDLGWRVEAAGAISTFAPDALVLHDINPGSFRSALREASTWIDIPRVTKQHPVRARPLLIHRVFWKESHEFVLLALVSIVAAGLSRRFWPLLGVLPWVYWRGVKRPAWRGSKRRRQLYLPHVFVLDAVELASMARGSVRHRTLVL
jgi:GT2 family glycosyltransferase